MAIMAMPVASELEAKIGLNEANALRLWRVLAADTELTITTASTATILLLASIKEGEAVLLYGGLVVATHYGPK